MFARHIRPSSLRLSLTLQHLTRASLHTTSPRMVLPAEQIKAHPAYKHAIWDLTPEQSGVHSCGKSRGGPYNIAYQLHGKGPIHIVLVMGLGGIMSSWQRQTYDFAHKQKDKYSVLVMDNRGMGASDKPFVRATTSGMAADTLEICDLVGWTEKKSLHVVGISMGGMIAQEIAWAAPDRVKTLLLLSTAARLRNTIGFLENLQQRAQLFIPKPLDEQIQGALGRQFTKAYVEGPDTTDEDPEKNFPTGGDRYAATEIIKKTTPGVFMRRGFMNQAWAAAWHDKRAEQLREMADKLGRKNILVMHGTKDQMITFPHAEVLVKELNAGGKGGEDVVRQQLIEGQGHVIPIEMRAQFREWLEEHIAQSLAA